MSSNQSRVEPSDGLHARLKATWLQFGSPSSFSAIGRMWMAHFDVDGTLAFLEIGARGDSFREYNSSSI